MATPIAIALVAHQGCYLIGQRGPAGPLPGYFEFPGGKCRPGEEPARCAERECWEETGLRVEVVRLRCQVEHTFAHDRVSLHFFDCRLLPESDPNRLRSQFFWVPCHKLTEYSFPEPNRAILGELSSCI